MSAEFDSGKQRLISKVSQGSDGYPQTTDSILAGVLSVREVAQAWIKSNDFKEVQLPGAPENKQFFWDAKLSSLFCLVDSEIGGGINRLSVAYAGFVFAKDEVNDCIFVTAPKAESISEAVRFGSRHDLPPHFETLALCSDPENFKELMLHEQTHLEDSRKGRNFAEIIYQARLYDMCDGDPACDHLKPESRPEQSWEKASVLLFELHAFSKQVRLVPELAKEAQRSIELIQKALKRPPGNERVFALTQALLPWRNSIPNSYDVGGEQELIFAAILLEVGGGFD